MNHTIARCGHYVPAIGAPHSDAREKCESHPCEKCAPLCQCSTHQEFVPACHWCNVRAEAISRMTDAERKVHLESMVKPTN